MNERADKSFIARVLDLLLRWRRFVAVATLASLIVSILVAFLIPPKFAATAVVFPAEKADLFGALEGVTNLARSLSVGKGLGAFGANPELDRYTVILKSGRVLGATIRKFNLTEVYDVGRYPMEEATKELLGNVEFTAEDEGNLVIRVFDEDPQRAADMANFFVDELSATNTELQVQNARGNRIFIEDRYKGNLNDLEAAQESLKVFQKKFGVVAMLEQTEASIKAGAELAAQVSLKEVQYGVERRTLAADHPDLVRTRIEIQELKQRIAQMNQGMQTSAGQIQALVPLNQIPDVGAAYVSRFRNVEIQYKILQFLTPLYEQAKVEENRNTPSVVVLDRASPPERKAKPMRMLIVLGGLTIGFIVAIGLASGKEMWDDHQSRQTAEYQSAIRFRDALREDRAYLLRLFAKQKKGQ